jgi:hypothetical protein
MSVHENLRTPFAKYSRKNAEFRFRFRLPAVNRQFFPFSHPRRAKFFAAVFFEPREKLFRVFDATLPMLAIARPRRKRFECLRRF